MRKIVKVAATVMTVLLVAVSLMACGVTGKYKHEIKLADLSVVDLGFGEAKIIVTLELKRDDTFSTSVAFKDLSEDLTALADPFTKGLKINGTYKVDGKKIVFTIAGVDSETTIQGGKIILKVGTQEMEFKK